MLTKEASNAVLKTLEEPPDHVVFVLCTTEMGAMLPTIRSRCQRFAFFRPGLPEISTLLHRIAAAESDRDRPGRGVARRAGRLGQLPRRRVGARPARHRLQRPDRRRRRPRPCSARPTPGSSSTSWIGSPPRDAAGCLVAVDAQADAGSDLGTLVTDLLAHLRLIFLQQQLGQLPGRSGRHRRRAGPRGEPGRAARAGDRPPADRPPARRARRRARGRRPAPAAGAGARADVPARRRPHGRGVRPAPRRGSRPRSCGRRARRRRPPASRRRPAAAGGAPAPPLPPSRRPRRSSRPSRREPAAVRARGPAAWPTAGTTAVVPEIAPALGRARLAASSTPSPRPRSTATSSSPSPSPRSSPSDRRHAAEPRAHRVRCSSRRSESRCGVRMEVAEGDAEEEPAAEPRRAGARSTRPTS